MGELRAHDGPAQDLGPDVADDGFDFGEFGHAEGFAGLLSYRFTSMMPVIVGWILQWYGKIPVPGKA